MLETKEITTNINLVRIRKKEVDSAATESSPVISGNFSLYLDYLNLSYERELIILPTSGHYYYEPEDFIRIKTIVDEKLLNHTDQLNELLTKIFFILPERCFFVGCFFDYSRQSRFSSDSFFNAQYKSELVENGISSRNWFLNTLYNFIDRKTNRNLTRKSVMAHIERAGLSLVDITEIMGLTYFCAIKKNLIISSGSL